MGPALLQILIPISENFLCQSSIHISSLLLDIFHDGSAADLHEVVEFYNTRFNIGLTKSEKDDLIAFLAAL